MTQFQIAGNLEAEIAAPHLQETTDSSSNCGAIAAPLDLLTKSTVAVVVFLIASALSALTNTGTNDVQVTEFHGFRIGVQQVAEPLRTSILDTVFEQLKIVESVNLPDSVLDFLRKIPLVLDPNLGGGSPALYQEAGANGVVRIRPVALPKNKPIILHELLHGYHAKVLTRENEEILRAYRKATQSHEYSADFASAHFLENPAEFFAVTASIFLFGTIQQPPFNCSVLAKSQPEYIAFLDRKFGHHACK
jgi:hypothetical protein